MPFLRERVSHSAKKAPIITSKYTLWFSGDKRYLLHDLTYFANNWNIGNMIILCLIDIQRDFFVCPYSLNAN